MILSLRSSCVMQAANPHVLPEALARPYALEVNCVARGATARCAVQRDAAYAHRTHAGGVGEKNCRATELDVAAAPLQPQYLHGKLQGVAFARATQASQEDVAAGLGKLAELTLVA